MKKVFLYVLSGIIMFPAFTQTVSQKLATAFQAFEKDVQLKNAISSLYVTEAVTGRVVFDKNSLIGLAPASSQKIITAATAFELLGKDYRYQTTFFVAGEKDKPSLLIKPSGDPTLGSWRWEQTKGEKTLNRILAAIRKEKVVLSGPLLFDGRGWHTGVIPDGWIWQDIGNYYGAGADMLNWRENQFDIFLQSGNKIGDTVKIVGTRPSSLNYKLTSVVTSAAKGSGDNAYAYFPLQAGAGIVRGTIPVNENRFVISASFPSGKKVIEEILTDSIAEMNGRPLPSASVTFFDKEAEHQKQIHTEISPSLDSIVYWFLRKSINLYGEALLKTMAYKEKGLAATDSGTALIKKFWKERTVDENELNIYDGSGLSPLNRVTTHAQVQVLAYARKQSWFPVFYEALPEYNGMKLKSGTIADVKAFCGYHKAKNGKEYIISFIVNNYNGPSVTLVRKMYRVLDVLK